MRYASCLLALIVVGLADAQYRFPPVVFSYSNGCTESLRTGKPLYVYVGWRPGVDTPDAVIGMTPTLTGYAGPCVVVAVAKGGDMVWRATLPCNATVGQLADARKEVRPAVVDPFRFVQSATATVCRT